MYSGSNLYIPKILRKFFKETADKLINTRRNENWFKVSSGFVKFRKKFCTYLCSKFSKWKCDAHVFRLMLIQINIVKFTKWNVWMACENIGCIRLVYCSSLFFVLQSKEDKYWPNNCSCYHSFWYSLSKFLNTVSSILFHSPFPLFSKLGVRMGLS